MTQYMIIIFQESNCFNSFSHRYHEKMAHADNVNGNCCVKLSLFCCSVVWHLNICCFVGWFKKKLWRQESNGKQLRKYFLTFFRYKCIINILIAATCRGPWHSHRVWDQESFRHMSSGENGMHLRHKKWISSQKLQSLENSCTKY